MKHIKSRLWVIPVILIAWLPYFMGAWDKAKPADDVTMDDAMAEIRANWAVLETAIGAEHVFTSVSQTGAHGAITSTSVTAGTAGSVQGKLIINTKDTNEFAYIELNASDGEDWFLFVENDGTLKIHTSAPTANTDGTEVGGQS